MRGIKKKESKTLNIVFILSPVLVESIFPDGTSEIAGYEPEQEKDWPMEVLT